MARVKIELPDTFTFFTSIDIRITDINYGGHLGNDATLSLIHEARIRFLKSWGCSELDCGGAGLIMSDVAIEFKQEAFYGDTIIAWVTTAAFSKVAFEIYYRLEKLKDGKPVIVALAKTGMVCYDYEKRKIVAVPTQLLEKMR